MTPERWAKVRDVVGQVLELAPEKRPGFLDDACDSDPSLRSEVESLLSSDESARTSFLQSPPVSPTQLTKGTRLGDYEIVSPVGSGGMGEVYRARDTKLKREVAIKVLPEFWSRDAERLRRFELEAQAAAALNHPNIISIHHVGQHDGSPYIVTELLEGETLRERLRRGPIPLRKAIEYAVQIASGLAAAHEKGIVHRDLKPENLFVTKDGRVKILDFGLAKLTQPKDPSGVEPTLTQATEPGVVMGTVGYMSPEQARGQIADHRSDIFAFGAILYEMVTGKPPFRKPTKADTISAILNEDPPAISQCVPNTPPGLQKVVHRCLEKSPEQRFQSASDLAFALGALSSAHEERLQGLGDVEIAPDEANKESESSAVAAARTRVPSTTWWKWCLAAVVMCSLVAALLWSLYPRPKTPARALKAVALTSNVGNEGFPTFSPDGNQVAFSWDGAKQDNTDIYVKLIGPGSPLRLTTDPAADIVPAWSPDGRTIAFLRDLGGGKYGILVIPALGGPEQKLLDVFMPEAVWLPAPYLAWLPDSKGIIYTNKDSPDHPSSLFLLLMESRETRRVTTAPEGSIGDSAPALSPDGSTLIFSRMAAVGPTDLYLLKLKADFWPAGECKRLTHYNLNGISASWTPDGRNIVFSHENWLWKLAISRSGRTSGEPHRLELVGNGGSSPALSNQGRRLAYVFGHSDPLNIWRIGLPGQGNRGPRNQASTGPTDLIPSTSNEFAPTYSPDGKKIAFESERTGNLEIWTCQSDGSNCTRLTFLGVKYTGVPHWSPDSQQIAFYSRPEGKAQIYVINAEGGAARRLTNDSWENFFPVWSRDGRWIYFASNRSGTNQIWKIPSDGGVPAQVTKNGGFKCMESADSKYLYYTRANESSSGLFKMPVEGGPETKVVDAVLLHNFAVTARGVYYMSQPDPRSKTKLIQFLSFADGKTTLITSVKQNLYVGFSISPDERWLVYAPSGRDGSNVMLVENFDADAS